jgi:hypothetical protein
MGHWLNKSFFLIRWFIVVIGMAVLQSCLTTATNKRFGDYNLSKPTKKIELPAILLEISDITTVNDSVLACVQDELGILFLYNINSRIIVLQDSFYVNGDYEGIAKVKDNIYVLQSDGKLIEINKPLSPQPKINIYTTGIPAKNNEGLCYDEVTNQLLIASKSKSGKGPELKDKRMIYAFDLNEHKLADEPLYEISTVDIKAALYKDKKQKDTLQYVDVKLKPSAIAINPVNGKLYMLSAASHLFCIINNGKVEYAQELDPVLFNKSEGICFLSNGDMIISNEGQTGPATLLYFKYNGSAKAE